MPKNGAALWIIGGKEDFSVISKRSERSLFSTFKRIEARQS
jgi:hypothetical protein